MVDNSENIKINPSTVIYPLASAWDLYRYIRDSPATLGSNKWQKAGTLGVYLISIVVALFLFFKIISHEAKYTDLIQHRDGAYETPSLILCPPKSDIYEYSAYYKHDVIKSLNLTREAVDALAESAQLDQLNSSKTKQVVELYSPVPPLQLWQMIVTGVYTPDRYDWGSSANTYYNYKVDLDCVEKTEWTKKLMRKSRLDAGVRFHCWRIQDVWLTDKSYCFLWNNTGTEMEFARTSVAHTDYFIFRLPPYHKSDMRTWIGSLFTDEVRLINWPFAEQRKIFYETYKVRHATNRKCQPLLQKCDEMGVPGPPLKEHFVYLISRSSYGATYGGTSKLSIVQQLEWFEIEKIDRFTGLILFEALGNVIGFFVGISFLGFSKVFIQHLKSHLTKVSSTTWIFIQIIGIMVLLGGVIALELVDFQYFKQNRYLNVVNVEMPKEGISWAKKIQICPRMMAVYNKTKMEEYNISQSLFNYLGVVGLGEIPMNFIQHAPKNRLSHFFWDQHTNAELGYHWHFMAISLQNISQDLYDTRMAQVEQEYKNLANKTGIRLDVPGYEVLKRLFLEPCKLIKYCYIDQKMVMDCCHSFHYVLPDRAYFPGCLELRSQGDNLNQVKPGKMNGLRILFDIDQITKHGAHQLWYDAYLKSYIEKCTADYNCTFGFPEGVWNPFDLWQLLSNSYVEEDSIYGKRMTPGGKIEGSYELINKKLIKRGSNCKDDMYEHNQFRLVRQMMLAKRCGCNICHGQRSSFFKNVPCCKPMFLGRCITKKTWYDSYCRTKRKWNPQGKSKYQLAYTGNISSDVPFNWFLAPHNCTWRMVMKDPDSKFYPEYMEILASGIRTMAEKPSCDSWTIHGSAKKVYNNSYIQNAEDRRYYEFHVYYPLIQYTQFYEMDLLTMTEVISLIAGAMGLIFGLNYVSIMEIVLYFFYKSNRGVHTLCSLTGKANCCTFTRSLRRLIRIKKKFGTKATEKHPENIGTITNGEETCEPSTSKSKMHSHEAGVESSEICQPNTSQNKNNQDLELVDTYVKDVSKSTADNEIAVSEESRDLGLETKAVLFVTVLSGFGWAVYSCLTLQESIHGSRINTQFSIDRNQSALIPPGLGVCLNRDQVKSFAESQVAIQSAIHKCIYKENGIVKCSTVFSVFLRTLTFDCALTNFSAVSSHSLLTANDYEIQVNSAFNIWTGDITTIREDNLDVSDVVELGKEIKLEYQEWDIIDKEFCEEKNQKHSICPACSESLHSNLQYCCATESVQQFNFTANDRQFCHSSFYKTQRSVTTMTSAELTIGAVKVAPAVTAKRVIIKELRRSLSEEFMLYAGFIDIFIGLNIDNVFFVLVGLVVGCFYSCSTKP